MIFISSEHAQSKALPYTCETASTAVPRMRAANVKPPWITAGSEEERQC